MSEPRTDPESAPRGGLPLWALLAMVIWGGSFVATDVALETLGPFALVAARFVLGGLFLTALLVARGERLAPARGQRARCLVLGLVFAAHVSLQAFGMTLTSATHSGWIVAFTPVVIAIGAQVFLRERLAPLGWLGVALGLAGVLCVSLDASALADARSGDLLQFASCFTWAGYTLVSVPAIRAEGALRVAALSLLFGAAATLPGALVELAISSKELSAGAAAVPALLYLGLLASGLATTAWGRAQARYGPQRSAAVLYLQPFVTLVAAWTLRGEPIGLAAVLGGILVLCGVAFVTRARRAR
jgi:drug/metabolite transporter (DMT)-like permease